jgi:hypothetical protein
VISAGSNLSGTIAVAAVPKEKGSMNVARSEGSGPSDSITDMMGRLNLTPREAAPFILEDGGDVNLPCPDWALIGKVMAPNTLHV